MARTERHSSRVRLRIGVSGLAGGPCTRREIQVGQGIVATARILLGLELLVPVGTSSRSEHRSTT